MEEIKEPIGKLIIDSGLGEVTQNGLYLHYTDVITMMRAYAESQLKEKDQIISEYHTKMKADYESYWGVVEAYDDLKSQLESGVGNWNKFSDKEPEKNEEIIVKSLDDPPLYKPRVLKWHYNIYINDVKKRKLVWKSWDNVCK